LKIVKLSTGKDVSKTRWPAEVTYGGGTQVSPRWAAPLACRAYSTFFGLKQKERPLHRLVGRARGV